VSVTEFFGVVILACVGIVALVMGIRKLKEKKGQ